MAEFDWYQGTARTTVDELLEGAFSLAERPWLDHGKGMHGYGTTTRVQSDAGLVCQVWHGGTHHYPHFVFSGEGSQVGCEMIRARFDHHVTRLDPKQDFGGEHAFDLMQPVLLGAARDHRIRVSCQGDHLLTKQGRTLGLGAPSSAVGMRMYDKADELRAKFAADPVRLATVPEFLTRVELQVRPQTREAKQRFATIEPVEALGSSAWSRQVWRELLELELEPVRVTVPYRQADHDRAKAYMLAQYGGVLRAMLADAGDWACVGLQLGVDLAERERAIRMRKS